MGDQLGLTVPPTIWRIQAKSGRHPEGRRPTQTQRAPDRTQPGAQFLCEYVRSDDDVDPA